MQHAVHRLSANARFGEKRRCVIQSGDLSLARDVLKHIATQASYIQVPERDGLGGAGGGR
jgi:hypothetical protein